MILAVGLLGLAELQITAMRTNVKSESLLAAGSLVQGVIEQVIDMRPDHVMFNDDVIDEDWAVSPVTVIGGGTYNITYDVETTYQGVSNLCLVRINVTPANALNLGVFSSRAVTMTTLKRST
jgi:Tfp pilus assembly protein PilV